MTGLLESALRRVEALSPAEQDAIGAQIIETLEDDARWERSFRENPAALKVLAQEAIDENGRGDTRPLDEDFNRHTFAILRRELGLDGFARFLRLNRSGTGDYTRDRHLWLDGANIDSIMAAVDKDKSE